MESNKDFMLGEKSLIYCHYLKLITYYLAEYCGTMKNWVYKGAVAFSRNSPVSDKEMLDIETELRRHGFQPDDFCSPQYVGCSNLRQV